MTPGQLIDLLEKSGMLKEESPGVLGWQPNTQKAEAFAALVAAAEREACAQAAEAFHHHAYDFTGNLELHEFIRARGAA